MDLLDLSTREKCFINLSYHIDKFHSENLELFKNLEYLFKKHGISEVLNLLLSDQFSYKRVSWSRIIAILSFIKYLHVNESVYTLLNEKVGQWIDENGGLLNFSKNIPPYISTFVIPQYDTLFLLSIPQLHMLAKQKGLLRYSSLNKYGLVDLIRRGSHPPRPDAYGRFINNIRKQQPKTLFELAAWVVNSRKWPASVFIPKIIKEQIKPFK